MLKRMVKNLKRKVLKQLGSEDPEALKQLVETGTVEPEADGAFFPEATAADAKRQEQEDSGIAKWLDRLNKLP